MGFGILVADGQLMKESCRLHALLPLCPTVASRWPLCGTRWTFHESFVCSYKPRDFGMVLFKVHRSSVRVCVCVSQMLMKHQDDGQVPSHLVRVVSH